MQAPHPDPGGQDELPTAFEGPDPGRRGEALQTDTLEYEARRVAPLGPGWEYEFEVAARFTNAGPDSLFVQTCGGASPIYGVVPASGDDDVESAFDPAWACAGGGLLAVAPGAARVDTFTITGPTALSITFEPLGVFEGWWRLVYDVRRDRDDVLAPSDSVGVSNVFAIHLEP
ncbi:MAG: hypothetical protein R3195_10475 [Gemmatimonadota bacterium]|nr:hypothetical protein [Gemmatimonadota bacterium]